ncbi:iron-sulfur cluster assembly protein [Chitinophaga jiangningensis]|uniref:Iron-sulfur cluster assembly protein n=1 Tax=Chitinophaga jiangningensis TaxID=1419482 RepID=A0A1M6YNG1_9BACT|nr:iron-sulfur cluster assembly accessory protein [Chitinophaga jiangningensis]SHL19788.1 iron-sulfur cluster assembly protein [Chitinophaga jiangningensis]
MEAGFNVALQFTPAAQAMVKELLSSIATAPYLRVGVKGGGCSGMGYMIGFDEKAADDIQLDIGGIPVIMKKAHTMYLAGMQIDYQQQEDSSGFVFSAPQ